MRQFLIIFAFAVCVSGFASLRHDAVGETASVSDTIVVKDTVGNGQL